MAQNTLSELRAQISALNAKYTARRAIKCCDCNPVGTLTLRLEFPRIPGIGMWSADTYSTQSLVTTRPIDQYIINKVRRLP